MFGKAKYEYTCPDVIQLRAVAKKRNRNVIVGNLLSVAVVIGFGYALEKYDSYKNKPDLTLVPNDPA